MLKKLKLCLEKFLQEIVTKTTAKLANNITMGNSFLAFRRLKIFDIIN